MLKKSSWIKSPEFESEICPLFKKEIKTEKKIKKATVTATAIGLYYIYLNGKKVGNRFFTPGFTSYHKRLQYQTYDITAFINENNTFEMICAPGWAVGSLGYKDGSKFYGDHVSAIFEIFIEYEDDTEEIIASDENTDVYNSHILYSDIYHGEYVDFSSELKFLGKALKDTVNAVLISDEGEEIKEFERISPINYIYTPKNEFVIDFGQNLTGYVEIKIKGRKGDKIVLRHAEALDKDGNFYTGNLRAAKQTVTYILKGEGEETLKPSFSFQGFRYICLDEFPMENVGDDTSFTAIAVHSDIKRTGEFICGNEKINQLYHNIIWGQKCNFLDVPTDCPQRNERLGWTGDAQVFCKTATINFDVERFFSKWLGDLRAEQKENGTVYAFSPSFSDSYFGRFAAGWGDAAVICPWTVYLAYGDKKILEDGFDSMVKWVEYIHNFGDEEYLWLGGHHYGDWLAIDNGEGVYEGRTSKDYIASCYFYYSTTILVKTGKILNRDVKKYEDMLPKIKEAVYDKFFINDLPVSDTQTACAMALYFGIAKDSEKVAKRLSELVLENDTRLNTGFLGTPYLLHALSDNGYEDIAYELLFSEKFPSWLYSVNKGATTMWEHWDGVKEDGNFWSDNMNSFNHYAYGAVFDWIFKNACGISIDEAKGAGYKYVVIEPKIDKRLGFVKSSVDTRCGKLELNWYINSDGVHYEITIPDGMTALLKLHSRRVVEVTGGKYMFVCKKSN